MYITFRIDASTQIGSGHFMRCLALADVLHKHGAEIHFVCRYIPQALLDMLVARNYEFTRLVSEPVNECTDLLAHADWLGTDQQADALDTITSLSGRVCDWLVVDHYALGSRWETILRSAARHILVIDDLADRIHDCDVLLDQNLYSDMDTRYSGKLPASCELLLGPRYALLRPEFRLLRKQSTRHTGAIKRILILLGGVDADNYTGQAIKAVSSLEIEDLQVDVVIGSQHPFRGQIESLSAELGFTCYVQTDDVATLMSAADLAIGAAGSTSWERCCLGLPTICLATAKNQIAIADGLQRHAAIVKLSCDLNEFPAGLLKTICSMIECPDKLISLSDAAHKLVDGLGVQRVSDRMFTAA